MSKNYHLSIHKLTGQGIAARIVTDQDEELSDKSIKLGDLLLSCFPDNEQVIDDRWEMDFEDFLEKYENSELHKRALKIKAFI